jgi:NADH-quinone oxidoreductase E subunit
MTNEDLEAILTRYPVNKKDGLLPILQEIQYQYGFLTDDLLAAVARYLNLPASKVYGVATFYDQFRFHPRGRHHIRICKGTSCHLFGSSTYLDELERQLRLKAGNISRDHKFSLEISTCMGACESAPVIQINDTVYTRVTEADLHRIICNLKEKTKKDAHHDLQ